MILDTNALSVLADGDLEIATLIRRHDFIAIPVVVLGEYRYGIKRSRHRLEYENWLAQQIERVEILPITQETAVIYAEIRHSLKIAGRPMPSNEVWIAALAREHQLPIASQDRHFDSVAGVIRVEW